MDEWLEAVGGKWGLNPRTVFSARLCIAELANNVLEHGRNRSDDDRIVVVLTRHDGGLDVEFMDTRAPFDPTVEPPRAEDLLDSIGGRGLLLIHKFARELSYSHDGRFNRTLLKFA